MFKKVYVDPEKIIIEGPMYPVYLTFGEAKQLYENLRDILKTKRIIE